MNGFRLEHFPKVCHLCLQHQPEILLISLDTLDPSHGLQLRDVVNELMYPISQELQHLTLCGICQSCNKELNEFLVYRNRLKFIGKFVSILALLQIGQTSHLEEFLREHQTELLMVLHDLKVTDKHQLAVQDLLDELNQYYTDTKQEPKQDGTFILNSLTLKESEDLAQNQYLKQHGDGEIVAVETNKTTKELSHESEETEGEVIPNFEQMEFNNHLCITYRENCICCNRDFKYHYFYNKHMFLVHGEQSNVRVKPIDGVLLGQYRAKRKRAERCPTCEQEFATRQQKKNHMKQCGSVQFDNTIHVAGHEEKLFLTMNTVSIVLWASANVHSEMESQKCLKLSKLTKILTK